MFKWIFPLGAPVIFEATKLACCTRFSGVKIPFRFWSIDGARLKLNAARNILTQTTTKDMLQYSSSSSMSQLGFNDGEVRSNLPFLKSAETVFLLAAGTVTFKRKIES